MSHQIHDYLNPPLGFGIPDERRSEIAQMLRPVNRSVKSLEAQAHLLGEMMATLTMERNKTSLRENPALIEELFRMIEGWERRYITIKEEAKTDDTTPIS